jgi:hypothetical protein
MKRPPRKIHTTRLKCWRCGTKDRLVILNGRAARCVICRDCLEDRGLWSSQASTNQEGT